MDFWIAFHKTRWVEGEIVLYLFLCPPFLAPQQNLCYVWTSWKGNILLFLLVSNTGLDGIGSVNAKAINHIAQCYRIKRTVSFALIHCADNLYQAKFQHRFC